MHKAAPPLSRPLVIKPSSGWSLNGFRQLWCFRGLLVALGLKEIRLRYKHTALGIVWVVVHSLMGAAIFSLVFGIVAKLPSDGTPYFVFPFAGVLGWTLFGSALTRISGYLVLNTQLISKTFFPRLILSASAIPCVLLDLGVGLVVIAGLKVSYDVPLSCVAPSQWSLTEIDRALKKQLGRASRRQHADCLKVQRETALLLGLF